MTTSRGAKRKNKDDDISSDAPVAAASSSAAPLSPSASAAPPAKHPKPKRKAAKDATTNQANGQEGNAALAPLRAHPTLVSFYASRTVSACPCMMRVGGGARLLVVGDGDLSYSVGLVRHLCSAAHNAHEIEGGAEQQKQQQRNQFDNCVTEDDARAFYSAIDPTDPAQLVRPPSSLQLTCTTYESAEALQQRYAESGANAALLRSWGIKVMHGIDARTLESYGNELEPIATAAVAAAAGASAAAVAGASCSSGPASCRPCTFHHILFHFPHVGGKSRIHLNRALVDEFLTSARGRLVQAGDPVRGADGQQTAGPVELRGGCVHVSLLRGQGGTPCDPTHRPRYADHWQLQEAGARANLVLAHVLPFHPQLYPGYNNKGFRSRDEEFSCRRGTSITHVLVEPAQSVQIAPSPSPAPAAVQVRREDCVATDCDHAGCVTSLDGSLLSAEMRELLRRRLCDMQGHPLQQVRACIERTLSALSGAAGSGSGSAHGDDAREDAEAGLRAQGLVRQTLCAQGASAVPCVRSSLLQQAAQTASITAAAAPLPSSIRTVVILDDSPLDSLQWNLDQALAVSGDLDAQMPLPLAVQLQLQSKQAAPSSADAASNGGRGPADASADLADTPVVPFMCAGVSVLHEQRVVQLFDRAATSATQPSSSAVEDALLADMRAAARATMAALFGPAVAVGFRRSAGCDSEIPASDSCPTRCTHHTEVLLRHADGVWHAVARGGLLPPPPPPPSPSGSSNVAACGWTLRFSLDKLAMLRHSIPDVRWLWSRDARFIDQFRSDIDASTPATASVNASASAAPMPVHQLVPFSLHPIVYIRDNSFWLNPVAPATTTAAVAEPSEASSASSAPAAASPGACVRPPLDASSFERIYTRALVRLVGSSYCVSVRVTDRFTHPTRGEAMRFRCIYQSVDRALAHEQVAELQRHLHQEVIAQTGVEIR